MPPLRFQLLRTLFRYAFHAAAGFSALALVACLILWPRSYFRSDGGGYQGPARLVAVTSTPGRLSLLWQAARWTHPGLMLSSGPLDPFSRANWSYATWRTEHPVLWGFLVFQDRTVHTYLGVVVQRDPKTLYLQIPFSYLTLLSALLPAVWLRAWRRRAQRARGFPVEPAGPAAGRAVDAGVSPADAEATVPSAGPGAASAAGDGSAAASRGSAAVSRDSLTGPGASLPMPGASPAAPGASAAGPRELPTEP